MCGLDGSKSSSHLSLCYRHISYGPTTGLLAYLRINPFMHNVLFLFLSVSGIYAKLGYVVIVMTPH